MISAAGWLLASYLVGAIPTSYLVARAFRGIDLREHGSRNLGATNVYRVLGWRYAIPVGVVDAAKGAVAIWVFGPRGPGGTVFPLLCGLAAVVGHTLSVFVGFKGGKGVATAAGVVLALSPWAFVAALALWAVLVRLTGYVSVGSVTAAALFPAIAYLLGEARGPVLLLEIALALVIIAKHRSNLARLARGTENRFGRPGGEVRGPGEVAGRPS